MVPNSLRPALDLGRYRPVLRLLAWQLHLHPRLQRRFDGSDLVHEALVNALKAREQFRGTTEAELIRWLHEILNNTFRDLIRRERAKCRDAGLEVSLNAIVADSSARLDRFLSAEQSSPQQRLERQEILLRFARAVEQLPPEQRDVVLLRDLYELPVKQIAERLGCTEKAVAGRLLRGRQQLRQSFQDYQ
jgi:RNA polymerase sigma-70 factor (ECF subfamily)